MTVELPTEIWWKILEYLPLANIVRLGPVNRIFLELARQKQYRSLKFTTYDREIELRLENIRSLSLGRHVRAVNIHPSTIGHGPAKMLKSSTDFVRTAFDSDHHKQNLTCEKIQKEQIQLVIETLKTLEHVQQFCLVAPKFPRCNSRVWPGNTEVTIIFLSLLATPSFSRNITGLELTIPAHTLDCLASAKMPSLEYLNVFLVKRPQGSDEYIERLAMFISGASRTLQILSIECSDRSLTLDQNFSRLFGILCEADFPQLDVFHFHILSHRLQNIAVNLNKFVFKTSSRLHELKLCYLPYIPCLQQPPQPNNQSWISDIFFAQGPASEFSSLTLLNLNSGSVHVNLAALSPVLSSVAPHLKSFSLDDQLLTTDELQLVIQALSCSPSPLCHLRIEPKDLSLNTFDLMASQFPQLQSLELVTETFSSSVTLQAPMTEEDLRLKFPRITLDLALFSYGMTLRRQAGDYQKWKLSSLELYMVYQTSNDYFNIYEETFKACLPLLVDYHFRIITRGWSQGERQELYYAYREI
ncbi:hypothetical protein D9757_011991 [Collybiopsis confluens]|uniref:F-box domain-containing protein n=1 Tax=Collybiopsis confluens TaxID=2823264 RepID=A0A8H5LU90_9AGAR|nr:hypothetical protein D9757_011991 [Collybiopsis confluens]